MSPTSPRLRAVLITLLDAGLIVAVSAALVIALGGRTRFAVAGVRITLRGTANLVVLSAVLAAVRLYLGRGLRLLPAFQPATVSFMEEERQRLVALEPWSRRVAWYAVLAGVGSIIWMLPQLVHLRDVPDPGDPVFSAWRIAALAHQLFTDPAHLWNGNIFYPLPLTITYSDSLFLQSLIGAPFLLAGVDPLLVSNSLMVVSFPARGLAFFLLGWRITGSPQAALVTALVGAWSPFYPQHYSQLELNWSMFVPLALLGLLRMLAAPGWKTGLRFGAALAAQFLASMYISVMLVSVLVPFGVVIALAWRVRPSVRVMKAAAGAALIALPVVAGLGVPYMKGREAHGDRSLGDVAAGSASPWEYGHAHIRLVTQRWRWGRFHMAERELFPGVTPLALGAAGLIPPLTPISIAVVASGAAAFDWSLGLKGLTYDDLYRRSAVYRGLRVAARFSAMVHAALALLAGYGARRLLALAREGRARAALCAILCAGVLVDLRMDPGLVPYLQNAPDVYRAVTPEMVLAEMPATHVLDFMYFSTRHWARLLDGYSGFFPDNPDFDRARREFPSPTAVAAFHTLGATHLTYICAFEISRERCESYLNELSLNPTLELVASDRWRNAPVMLYRFR